MLLGCVYAITHLAVIAYASEATTNGIRTGLLTLIAFIRGISTLFTITLVLKILDFDQYKKTENISANQTADIFENPIETDQITLDIYVIVSFCGIIIMAIAMFAIILAIFINRESIPYLVRKTKYVEAYDEFLAVHSSSKYMTSNRRGDFEIWKNNILLQPKHCANILMRENVQPLKMLFITRILSMLYSSILLTIISIHHLNRIANQKTYSQHMYDHSNQEDVLNLLLTVKASTLVFGLILHLIGLKWNTDRYYFIASFMWSLGALFVYLAYSCFYHFLDDPPPPFMEYFVFYILIIYLLISFKFEIFYYQQISKIYHEFSNNYKIWSLVCAESSAYLMQILMVLFGFLLNSFSILVTDFGIIFISFWFVKEARRAEKV